MSVKRMVDLYLNYGLDNDTWSMLWEMANHGLISRENWIKFFEKCKDWEMDDDGNAVINGNGEVLYRYDGNGNLVKVK